MKKYNWEAQLFAIGDDDIEGILDLVRSYYGETDECYPEYFRWEYIDNPAGSAIIWTAKRENKIVGQYVANPIRVKIGDNIKLGSVAIKTLVREDFRSRGIHIYLAKMTFQTCRERGIGFTFGLPNPNVYKPCIERLGYRDIGRIPLLIRPINMLKLVDLYIKDGFNAWVLKLLVFPVLTAYYFILKTVALIESNLIGNKKIFLKEIDKFDQHIDILWEKIKMKYKNIVVRNKEFLNWRYCQNPRRIYKIFTAKDNKGTILSYVILRVSNVNNIKVGYIVDILSDEEKYGYAACYLLINKVLDYFRKESVDLTGCLMLPDKIYFRILRKYGFIVCPQKFIPRPFPFVIKLHTDNITDEIYKVNSWFITLGDFDVV